MIARFTKHLLGVLMFFVTLTATAGDYIGAAPETGKSYYIYNVGTGLFLSEGDNWGTHASVNNMGTDVKLTAKDTGFNIKTHFGSKNLSWADNGLWMDQSDPTQWNFTLVDGTTNRYYIQRQGLTTYFQCAEGESKVKLAAMPTNAELAQWILVPVTELEERVAAATYTTPVEATYLLANPRFDVSYADEFKWTDGLSFGGYRGDTPGTAGGNYVAYARNNKFDSYTTVTAPKGIYKLCAQGANYSSNGATSLDGEIYLGKASYVVLPEATDGNFDTMAKAIADGGYVVAEQMIISNATTLNIGFRKTTAQQGDITMIDNLRLYYYGGTLDDYKAFLTDVMAEARSLQSERMTPEAAANLQATIDKYKDNKMSSASGCALMSNALSREISAAKRSMQYVVKLKSLIDEAKELAEGIEGRGVDVLIAVTETAQNIYESTDATVATDAATHTAILDLKNAMTVFSDGLSKFTDLKKKIAEATRLAKDETSNGLDALKAAIEKAQTICDDKNSVGTDAEQATADLEQAITDFNFANASGTAPTVTTDTRFARGGTMAFGRMKVSGVSDEQILEKGFCYATHPDPTYDDGHSTLVLNNGVYYIKDLTPGTIYYMRAYALTKKYAIGYGDVLKVITIPKGNVSYGIYGFPADAHERVAAGAELAAQMWNDLTSISGYWSSINYGSGTPTADCSYGGWMRIGPNASYQRTGTILHEWLHGVGVGTHGTWWNTELHNGVWLGERANEVLRFWDNNPSATMAGDGTHMWPYGVNGAHEDNGSNELYMANSLIIQGLCEDGLIPTGGFCLPAYTLPVDNDNKKYYLKSESKNHGFQDSYLFVESDGSLKWKQATPATVTDNAAWTITFTPDNAYYQMKNVGTGRYLTYNGSTFTTAERTAPTAAENLHVMKGRVDVADIEGFRGYWLINPNNTEQPPTMTAAANGKVTSSAFNIANAAVTQRWTITTMEEVDEMEAGLLKLALDELNEAIKNVRGLLATPHTEVIEDADNTLTAILDYVEGKVQTAVKSDEVTPLITAVQNAELQFLESVVVTDEENPFDLTYKIVNPRMSTVEGWTKTADPNGISFSCAEFYERTFDFNQTITGLARGKYRMTVNAFQRPGKAEDVFASYDKGDKTVTTSVYAGQKVQPVMHAVDGASTTKLGGNESTSGTLNIPNNMEAASLYFAKGLYVNTVDTELTEDRNSLKIGIKCTSTKAYYWTIFDDFRLYSFGNATGIVGIDGVDADAVPAAQKSVYSINGTLLRSGTDSLEGLPRGIYIVNGKKVAK